MKSFDSFCSNEKAEVLSEKEGDIADIIRRIRDTDHIHDILMLLGAVAAISLPVASFVSHTEQTASTPPPQVEVRK